MLSYAILFFAVQNTTTIIILGITGDLSQKKILPALFDLYKSGRLSSDVQIVGFSRRPLTNDEIKNFVRDILPKENKVSNYKYVAS